MAHYTGEVKNGVLTIQVRMKAAKPSKTGKTLLIVEGGTADCEGATVDGKQVKVSLNAWVNP